MQTVSAPTIRVQTDGRRRTIATPHTRVRIERTPYNRHPWQVDLRHMTFPASSAAEAITAVRSEIDRARRIAGDRAAAAEWDALCKQQHSLAKARCTVAGLLRSHDGRKALAALDGRKYSQELDALATRKVITAAREAWLAREARRADRKVAEAARHDYPGRIARDAETRRQAAAGAAVSRLLDRHYRCATAGWAGGETTNLVGLADHPKATSDTTKEWSRNGKWSGLSLARHVHVAPHWLRDVQARGLAVVDGMVTTHASPLASRDGIETFAASWIRQGRGMEIRIESGAIARHVESGTTYHADDADLARRGLRRKLTSQGVPREVKDARKAAAAKARAERAAKQVAKLVDMVRRWDLSEIGHVEVTRRDSLRAGNCTPGTDGFIDRFFPERDPDSSATIAELAARAALTDLSAITGDRLTLARQVAAACLIAIRRDRQAARLLSV